ncbi:MAG TPA: M3 family oligoendopeptidase [Actinomycetota bacterium]|jgi:pepF/M3 family oligoendopeptidase|nr:M3 family oligoendopeptidase [Actinomycetota bacterium]
MTDTLIETQLPHWDMTTVFPSLESDEFKTSFDGFVTSITDVRELFDRSNIRKTDDPTVSDQALADFETILTSLNAIAETARTLRAYVHAFVSTEAQNDTAQARNSEFQMHFVELDKLDKRLVAWVGSVDVDSIIERSSIAHDHEFWLRRTRQEALHQMSELEEDLGSSLGPSGQGAWAKLHGNVTSRVMVDLTKPDGTTERLPMATVAGMVMQDPDPAIREAAYKAALATWPTVEVPLAAALNSIKGWNNEINRRRGWPDAIEPALFANNIDRATLEAMQSACVDSFPDFRRYFKAKAKLFGKDRLPWWDLAAPVGAESKRWTWDETASFIVEQFGTYSDRLAELAARAFLHCWIDAEPREGKRSGGFCMGVQNDESRILVNFTNSFLDVATVAHELGHAYHNVNLAHRTPFQRRTPMALAETASTFCETIVTRAMLAQSSDDERIGILNGDLVRDSMIVVSIHSRFLFEKELCERREQRELSASELCTLMADSQLEVFGDAIDPEALHPYMWCVSPHYYGLPFYNWPYTFGLLFGLGLYKRYEEEPDMFRAGYDDLLSATGMDDAAGLCARFGIDVRTKEFWASSLDVVRERIEEFERLAG